MSLTQTIRQLEQQLRQAERRASSLRKRLSRVAKLLRASGVAVGKRRKKRRLSAKGRANISAAQKRRWARHRKNAK